MKVPAVVSRFRKFCERVNIEDKIAILYDTDPDGVSSAAIVAKAIERLRKKPVDLIFHSGHADVALTYPVIEMLKKKQIGLLITVDKPIEQNPATLQEGLKHFEMVIFDHHRYEHEVNSEKCIWIKPGFFSDIDPGRYPTAKMVYDLFYPCVDIQDLDWMSAIGTVSDGAYLQWNFFIDEVIKKYRIPTWKPPYEVTMNFQDSELIKAVKMITSTISVAPEKTDRIVEVMTRAKGYNEFVNSELGQYEKAYDHEFSRWANECAKKGEVDDSHRYVFYFITPKYGVRSALSNMLSVKNYPGWLVVIVEEMNSEDMLGVSIRDQSGRYNCIELIHKCMHGLENASGGGHIPAVGGRIMKKDYEMFKARLKEEVNKKD